MQTLPNFLDSAREGVKNSGFRWKFVELPLNKKLAINHNLKLAQFLQVPELIENNSLSTLEQNIGIRIAILDENDNCLGTSLVVKAEFSSCSYLSGISKENLTSSIIISDIAVEYKYRQELLPSLLYFTLRRGRIWGRTTVISFTSEENTSTAVTELIKLNRTVESINNENAINKYHTYWQRLDFSIYHAWKATSEQSALLLRQYFVPEAVEILKLWMESFFETSWFQAVHNGTLTKEQYIYTLSNTYQYVRHTTRLIGRAVGFSHDQKLRSHWINHLDGEIDHEVIIERDLKHLDADVNYVINGMVPNVATQEFMVAQESAIAFHQDPVLLMAAPFVAEGFTSHLDKSFIKSLEDCASKWGLINPKLATKFFTSHVSFDGGSDGHWENICTSLPQFLNDDIQLQHFLNINRLCMNAFENSYSSYINDLLF
jgi:hypothetical protein